MHFSDSDIQQITKHGLTVDIIEKQIADFVSGFDFSDIVRPATLGDGICEFDYETRQKFIGIYQEYRLTHNIMTFVPASGAATRMFKDLYEFLDTGKLNDSVRNVCEHISEFAFYDELNLAQNSSDIDIVHVIVDRYGRAPKGLIPFHKYAFDIRTAASEHLCQSARYAISACNNVNIHFTVSAEHRSDFQNLFDEIIPKYSDKFDVNYNISMSEQKTSTDTIAVNPDNTPFRTDDGKLLFRPAGHGALIENLNDIDADLVFIKNIDNVCNEAMIDDTLEYKQVLAGVLIDLQSRIFKYLDALESDKYDVLEIADFIKSNFSMDVELNKNDLFKALNRPLRVCGMVKNTGAPGGGPFWVRGMGLQIIESSQIAPESRDIMNTATHFNPVDLVCGVRDYRGNKFNLLDFLDNASGFISEKSYGGRLLRAMERPGLWNGAMAYWNTVFVAVPGTTFTPVKTVTDLLTSAHKG